MRGRCPCLPAGRSATEYSLSNANMKALPAWSNLLFLLPLGMAVYFRIWLSAVILCAVLISSFVYHLSRQKKLAHTDALLAKVLILSNVWICYLGRFSLPWFAATLILAGLALYFYFCEQNKNYILWHGLWHLSSALITVFSILTFLGGS